MSRFQATTLPAGKSSTAPSRYRLHISIAHLIRKSPAAASTHCLTTVGDQPEEAWSTLSGPSLAVPHGCSHRRPRLPLLAPQRTSLPRFQLQPHLQRSPRQVPTPLRFFPVRALHSPWSLTSATTGAAPRHPHRQVHLPRVQDASPPDAHAMWEAEANTATRTRTWTPCPLPTRHQVGHC